MRQDFGDLRAIQIFRKGTWAGIEFDDAALDAMVANYHALKDVVAPRLKVGHDDVDGAPALGYITDLRRAGDFLEADFSDVPDVVLDAIQRGSYRDCSIEAYPKVEQTNLERNLKTGRTGPLITACAILGSQLPEVKGLRALPRLAAAEDEPTAIRVTFVAQPRPTLHAGATRHPRSPEEPMGDTDLEKPAKQSAKSAAEITKLTEQLAADRAERATLEERLKLAEERAAETPALKAQLKATEDETKRLSEDNARQTQRRREMEADAFVMKFSNKENLRVMPAERKFWRAAYLKLTASTDKVIVCSEDGANEEHEGVAFMEAWLKARPEAKALLTTMSEATKPDASQPTLAEATQVIAKERGLDMSNPRWVAEATTILCTDTTYAAKFAHLIPARPGQTTH